MKEIIKGLINQYPSLEIYSQDMFYHFKNKPIAIKDIYKLSFLSSIGKLNEINSDKTKIESLKNRIYANILILKRDLLKRSFFKGKVDNLIKAFTDIIEIFNSNFDSSIKIVENVIDKYENLYGFSYNDKFLFPCNGSGIFAISLIVKLMKSKIMINKFKNEKLRFKYILENQIYIIDKDPFFNLIFSLIVDSGCEFSKNIIQSDFFNNKYSNVKFTAIFFEPDFITSDVYDTKKSFKYIYQDYIDESIKLSDRVVSVTPARWLQTNSNELKKLKKFREKIKNNLRVIDYYGLDELKNSNKLISNNGGLVSFIYDKNHTGLMLFNNKPSKIFDIIITDPELSNFISKIETKLEKGKIVSINKRYLPPSWSGLKTNDCRLSNNGAIKVYVSHRISKNLLLFTNKILLNKTPIHLNSWKLITPETASTTGKSFSRTFLKVKPNEMFTQTYFGFQVNSKKECEYLQSYLETNFVKKLISIRKIRNHISKDTLKWVPEVPLTQNWTDEEVFKYFKLTKKEKQLFL